ncbi:histone deacetylase family protein [Rhodobacter sp. CZR27]|uniref:histone deacetylase family protein n=1 Tax=Rhodobacter sp. CZR27 TaxID=2033869 RepID=UPI000BBE8BB2|nr:histone deacetylase family protein [Rhodobacter sp. CZR27]
MTVAWFTHPAFAEHATPEGHPERPERMAAVAAGLDGLPLDRREAPVGDWDEVLRCHPQAYVDRIRAAEPAMGAVALDPDTWMAPGSLEAALRGVGGACAAVDLVLSGEVASAFVGCRPPGHHAERERPMGFCLFGNVAIAAKRALDHHGLGRVAIVDFDVHHGNGTQDLLWDEDRVLFVSSHQMPLYPGTGAADENGAHGQILNVPLRPGTGGPEMREAYEAQVLPRLDAFRPELILISAGFDAHAADPLAGLNWRESDFRWLTGRLCDVAAAHCGGRVVSTLEGGYDLAALAASVAAHVGVLLERSA